MDLIQHYDSSEDQKEENHHILAAELTAQVGGESLENAVSTHPLLSSISLDREFSSFSTRTSSFLISISFLMIIALLKPCILLSYWSNCC